MKITRADLIEKARTIGQTVSAKHADAVDKNARFPAESFAALREAKLLSAYIPKELGGEGVTLNDIIGICHALGHFCSSTAMVYAMHQIQVACLVHHALEIPWHREFMKRISSEQLLLASATSEAGIGGNTRTSSCAVIRDGEKFSLKKNAIVISYGAHANAILVTARTTPESAPSDQVLVVVEKKDYSLDQTGGWDTLGMRGTESTGHVLTATGNVAQIIAHPYADISSCTMLPVAHLTWSALWLGIASDAVSRARAFVRAEARKNPGNTPPGALRVAEVMSELQMMRANLADMALDYADKIGSPDQLTALSFAVKMNHLKVGSSEMAVKIVNLALRVCGISGFRNDTPYSLGRHLRDVHSSPLMVSNDRILGNTASLLLALKEDFAL